MICTICKILAHTRIMGNDNTDSPEKRAADSFIGLVQQNYFIEIVMFHLKMKINWQAIDGILKIVVLQYLIQKC